MRHPFYAWTLASATSFFACITALAIRSSAATPNLPESAPSTYNIHHALTVKAIPAGAKRVRVWFWVPQEDPYQRVLDLTVPLAPEGYRIVRNECGDTMLYAEVANPTTDTLSIITDALVSRKSVSVNPDPDRAGLITEQHRRTFLEDLRKDVPFMVVDEKMTKLANEICGQETNVVRQAHLLYNYVVEHTQHYSRGPNAPKSSNRGDAEYCLSQGGGACTDLHSLFIALARARGIPTRLYFGSRLTAANEGKEMDPGYRCWVAFFAPSYGWVPCDLAAGNTVPDKKDFYFGGLDDRRVLFSEGRNFDLTPKQEGPRLNLLIRAYVEVDGKPHDAFDRVLKFTTINNAAGATASR
jgi:Transglutaminase-like enzymes, putative cysteine proteases